MPRPRALDDAKCREICALVTAGCKIEVAAHYVGCTSITIRREARRNPTFMQQLRSAQINSRVLPLQALRQAAHTHWRAAAWFLERVHPHEFGRRVPDSVSPADLKDWATNWFRILVEEVTDVEVRNRLIKRYEQLEDNSRQQALASRDPTPVRGKRRGQPKSRPATPPAASQPQDPAAQPPGGQMPEQTNLQLSNTHALSTHQEQNGAP
jgi:hypothetical protein